MSDWLRASLIRLYPEGWRRRYGEEFAALLAARRLTPAAIGDVALGALDAHLQQGSLTMGRQRWSLYGRWLLLHAALGVAAFVLLEQLHGAGPRPAVLRHGVAVVLLACLVIGGVAQWLVLRRHLRLSAWWLLATVAGAGAGASALLLLGQRSRLSRGIFHGMFPEDLVLWAAICGVIGTGQWLQLRRTNRRAGWWVLASAVAGAGLLPANAIAAGVMRALANSAPVMEHYARPYALEWLAFRGIAGGILYALVTGLALAWLYRPPAQARAQPVASGVSGS